MYMYISYMKVLCRTTKNKQPSCSNFCVCFSFFFPAVPVMGNSLSTNACLDVEDLQESTEVALAVVQSLEPAHTPPQDADANYLRQCLKCGNVSYLRQGVCLSPQCTDSYLSLPADEVGRRLQSWGKEDSTTKASSEQMEESRKKRLARDDWSGSSYKRSKGRKHAAWTASFRKGVHPRTGKEGMDKPVWWKGEYWIFQPKQGWVRTIQDANPLQSLRLQSLRLLSLRLVEKPQSFQRKRTCGFKKPERLKLKGWRSKSEGYMLLRPILACLHQQSLQWQRRKLWFSCTKLPHQKENNWRTMLWPRLWPKSQQCQRQRLL